MASANLELVRSIMAAWERGNFGSAEWAHPEVEFVPADEPAEPGNVRGREGIAEFMRIWIEDFEAYLIRLEPMLYAENERVVALFRQSATGKGSGAPVENQFALLYELEDGRVIRMRAFQDPVEAVGAAGRSAR